MSPTLTIDTESDPGSWRAALAPEGTRCAGCGERICPHSDAVYQGTVPLAADPLSHALEIPNG